MKILYLTFYFEPDLSAGSFRNTSLVKELSRLLGDNGSIHVITTMPNRYKSFSEEAPVHEIIGNVEINRVKLPAHKSGFVDQALSFRNYFFYVLKVVRLNKYDLVFASSSRLFTATTASLVSRIKGIPLYLDIRDIFVDTMNDVIKNKLIKYPLLFFLKGVERYTFSRANHINLISGGFSKYFSKYTECGFSYYTNGIDDEFLSISDLPEILNEPIIITYAGNIGEGQGLHKIVPQAAKMLGNKYKFRIIGDGGIKNVLEESILNEKLTNVELLAPTNRQRLIDYYKESHFLFLHLNDYKAFEKVLPSKIFEYGAFSKPIIAGVGGYSAEFIQRNLTNYILFAPGDFNNMVEQLIQFSYKAERRNDFIAKFNRSTINRQMADSIVDCK